MITITKDQEELIKEQLKGMIESQFGPLEAFDATPDRRNDKSKLFKDIYMIYRDVMQREFDIQLFIKEFPIKPK